MTVRVLTPPTSEPLEVAEARDFLRVDHDDENELIGDLIVTAREWLETFTRRQLLQATLQLTLDGFPQQARYSTSIDAAVWGACYGIDLPRPPLIAVASVQYKDQGGNLVTLDPSLYEVDDRSAPARLLPAFGTVWPVTRFSINTVTVTYTAGWTAATLPKRVKSIIRLLVAHLYENREAVVIGSMIGEVPLGLVALARQLRFGDRP